MDFKKKILFGILFTLLFSCDPINLYHITGNYYFTNDQEGNTIVIYELSKNNDYTSIGILNYHTIQYAYDKHNIYLKAVKSIDHIDSGNHSFYIIPIEEDFRVAPFPDNNYIGPLDSTKFQEFCNSKDVSRVKFRTAIRYTQL